MTVIALATGFLAFNGRDNSALGGTGIPSGGTGAQQPQARVTGADRLARAGVDADPARSCRALRRSLRYYVAAANGWRARMGAERATRSPAGLPCPRYLASLWRSKARAARQAYKEWREYHWHWQAWLPDKWARIGACETGYGQRPGRWDWNSGTYQGAFGFYHGSWDAFVPYADRKARPYPSEAYNATPRQQYEVALAIYRRYGLSGWGCRNA